MNQTRIVLSVAVALVAIGLAPTVAQAQGTLFVTNDRVGVGVANPAFQLHLQGNGNAFAFVQDISGVSAERVMLQLSNFGPLRFQMSDSVSGKAWSFKTAGGSLEAFDISQDDGTGIAQLSVRSNGNLLVRGNVFTANCPAGCGPDYVFEPDYELMALSDLEAFVVENRHLPRIPPAEEMESEGINMTALQLRLLEKVEELTLYTIQQQKTIEALTARLEVVEQPAHASR